MTDSDQNQGGYSGDLPGAGSQRVNGDEKVSFEQMNFLANRVANTLLTMGVRKGDKVIILLENCLELLYTWFGLAKIGVDGSHDDRKVGGALSVDLRAAGDRSTASREGAGFDPVVRADECRRRGLCRNARRPPRCDVEGS